MPRDKIVIGILVAFVIIVLPSLVYATDDGTYDATVTTDSGTYTVPVEVENGEVTHVEWPNGGAMSVDGAELDSDGNATGTNSRGDSVDISIDDYNNDSGGGE